MLAEQFRPLRRLSFIGVGRAGDTDPARRHEQIIGEAFANNIARDV